MARTSRKELAEQYSSQAQHETSPEGWTLTRLGDVAPVQAGYAFKSSWFSRAGIRLLRGINIVPAGTRWEDEVRLPGERRGEFAAYELRVGDTVIAMDRPVVSTGLKVARLKPSDLPALLLQRVGRFQPTSAIEPDFLYSFVRSSIFLEHVGATATGTQLPHISATDIATTPLPLPPLNEQRRIVRKIDALTEKSREAREALAEVPELLEQLRQSILAAAFRGDLTKSWREQHPDVEPASKLLERIRQERRQRWEEAELAKLRARGKAPKDDKWKQKYQEPTPFDPEGLPDLPEGWCWATVEELSVLHQYGTSAKTSDEDGIPVLRMGNIVNGFLDFDNLKYLPRGHHEFPELLLEPGDMLFNRTNSPELVGKSAVYHGESRGQPSPCSFASYLIRVRAIGLNSVLLAQYVNSPAGRAWVSQQVSQQVGQANVNGTKLKALNVPLPPEPEQEAILQAIDLSLRGIAELSSEEIAMTELLSRLDSAILARAFRGELVPQDPADEPASVLLERIRAEREAAIPSSKVRSKRTPKKSKKSA